LLTEEDIRNMKSGTRIRYVGKGFILGITANLSIVLVWPGAILTATDVLNHGILGLQRVFLRDDDAEVNLTAGNDLEYAEDVVDATPAVPECVCLTRDLMIRGCTCPRLAYERSLTEASS
jgi:hypothetical protein